MSTQVGTWPVARHMLPQDEDTPGLGDAIDSAVGVLWSLTGRQYGLRAVEARPCPTGACSSGVPLAPARPWEPVLDNGTIRNVASSMVPCGREGALTLPGPVHSLREFVVDGEPRDLGELHVEGSRVSMRSGGWPAQNLSQPSTEPGTWSIRYLQGLAPPPGAAAMVATLAHEFLNATQGGKCRLPRRTTQVQREGVTVSLVDPSAIFESGSTGLSEVDLFIRAHNPYKHVEQAAIWSPDQAVW